MTTEPDHRDKNQGTINFMYGLFGLTLVLGVLPYISAAILCVVLFVIVLAMAYAFRSRASKDSLLENHMTFMIRTIWIGSLFSLVTVAAGSLYLLQMVDNGPMMPCFQRFIAIGPDTVMAVGSAALIKIFMRCYHPFLSANLHALIVAGGITIIPPLVYFAVRYVRGLSRALKGYRVAKPKAWF